jgi:hypothetical protein
MGLPSSPLLIGSVYTILLIVEEDRIRHILSREAMMLRQDIGRAGVPAMTVAVFGTS